MACPRWSPDGRLVYYLSDRDGNLCVWAQRLDAVTKKPLGPPSAVPHEHSARYRMSVPADVARFDVANGVLVYWLAELTGNIWQTKVKLDRPGLAGFR